MKKIGIITRYYGSTNYGGMLQSYALAAVLNGMGYDAEQICYKQMKAEAEYEDGILSIISKHFLYSPVLLMNLILGKLSSGRAREIKDKKRAAFKHFAETKVPHSDKVYSYADIDEIGDLYDVYITGSDQVWNGYNYGFMLDFVSPGRRKISYSASIAREHLNGKLAARMKETLESYYAVSVREAGDRDMLQPLCGIKVSITADPVFLVDASVWRGLASERIVKDKYIFCYFLGHNTRSRRLAEELSLKLGCRLINIPMFRNGLYSADAGMNAESVPYASPEDFLSYIMNAELVVTDSFHAVAFSLIFETPFFVMDRDIRRYMKSRIENIVGITGTEHRYCAGRKRESLEYLTGAQGIDFAYAHNELEKLKRESMDYLSNSIG